MFVSTEELGIASITVRSGVDLDRPDNRRWGQLDGRGTWACGLTGPLCVTDHTAVDSAVATGAGFIDMLWPGCAT